MVQVESHRTFRSSSNRNGRRASLAIVNSPAWRALPRPDGSTQEAASAGLYGRAQVLSRKLTTWPHLCRGRRCRSSLGLKLSLQPWAPWASGSEAASRTLDVDRPRDDARSPDKRAARSPSAGRLDKRALGAFPPILASRPSAIRIERRKIGSDAESRSLGNRHASLLHGQGGADDQLTPGVGMAIPFEEPVAPNGREQVQGGEQRNTAAEHVGTVELAALNGRTADAKIAGDAAPFGHVRLQNAQDGVGNGLVELTVPEVLASGERDRRRRSQSTPIRRGRVDPQRLLQPLQIEGRGRSGEGERSVEGQRLIGVGHERQVATQHRAQRLKVLHVAFLAEPNL